jgi:hypothetical protein
MVDSKKVASLVPVTQLPCGYNLLSLKSGSGIFDPRLAPETWRLGINLDPVCPRLVLMNKSPPACGSAILKLAGWYSGIKLVINSPVFVVRE